MKEEKKPCLCNSIAVFSKHGVPRPQAIVEATLLEWDQYTVVKRGNKWCVIHGHPQKEGSKTDKPKGSEIACHDSKEKAMAQHRAIEASKTRRAEQNSKGEGDGRPPKDWFDACKARIREGNPGYSEEQVNATCGEIWHNRGVRKQM